MAVEVLPVVGTVGAWRAAVRRLAAAGTPPEAVTWSVGSAQPDLLSALPAAPARAQPIRLSREAVAGLEQAMLHRDPERFALGHAAVLRLSTGSLRWGDRSDPAMRRLLAMGSAVRRDIHKMHAFVRFREVPQDGARRRFCAWFEPEHPIAEATGPFFARRFGDMDWAIATPEVTLVFQAGNLACHPTEAPPPEARDATEDLWRTYFAAIFNPARLNTRAMQSEMPVKYWKNLPEAQIIPDLVRGAPEAVARMHAAAASAAPPAWQARAARARAALPARAGAPATLAEAAQAARDCARCPLHGPATQTVWGEGPEDAALMIVGEAPGDAEDLRGRPFVGPAGQVLDRALATNGIDRATVYLTNAIKHFRFQPRGKRRLHQNPDAGHVEHCRWWLDLERRLVRPRVILGLGAVAAMAISGSGTRLMARRGRAEALPDGAVFVPTLHPAHVLRNPDPAGRDAAQQALAQDLALAHRLSLARAGG
ncbi:UdgX family uracil-DNA binding protein [Pararhodobacter sp. SW119]|uniref:UdgX family uracil-DNA binding protein n=1 Tax=Pararhodobacter sp. SW119 TaxID=2780075 RepID=UPI001ADEF29B|nr:UdgX family uracil-DNA binding protein [Pararhodobacter sp. SW119]